MTARKVPLEVLEAQLQSAEEQYQRLVADLMRRRAEFKVKERAQIWDAVRARAAAGLPIELVESVLPEEAAAREAEGWTALKKTAPDYSSIGLGDHLVSLYDAGRREPRRPMRLVLRSADTERERRLVAAHIDRRQEYEPPSPSAGVMGLVAASLAWRRREVEEARERASAR